MAKDHLMTTERRDEDLIPSQALLSPEDEQHRSAV